MSNWKECQECKIFDDQINYCRHCGAAQNTNESTATVTQHAQTEITPGVAVVCSNRECDWRDKYGMCSHVDGKCDKHYILNPA